MKVCLIGYTNIFPEQKLNDIRKNAIENDWTKKRTDEEILEKVKKYIEDSKQLSIKCESFGFKYYDISTDFSSSIMNITSELINKH